MERELREPRAASIRLDTSGAIIKFVGYVMAISFAFMCIVPFWIIITGSFSAEKAILVNGFSLWPQDATTFAYSLVFRQPQKIIGSYLLTIILTVSGTAIGLIGTSMAAYALCRPDFQHRNYIALFIYFTTLFSGGLIPWYMLITRYLNLKNNYLVLILPSLFSQFNVFLMRNFMKGIPHSITESALIDGAGDMNIFTRIILPMSGPSLATVGLFIGLGYWNQWYAGMLFIDDTKMYHPLQLLLYNIINSALFIRNSAAASNIPPQDVPFETMKMACAVVATGPIVVAYPFVQRFFIKGITIGAVKG